MLDKLSSGLKEALRKLTKAGYIDSKMVEELSSDIYRTLIAGDVEVGLAKRLTEEIKNRSLNEKPPAGMSPKEHVVNIVYQELVKFVGKKPEISLKPKRILFIGLFGSGKTTSIAKLAKFYQKKGLKPALIGCDVHRPAAMEQIAQLAKQINTPYFAPKDNKDPTDISKKGAEQLRKYDVLIFDSSGRNALDKELAEELRKLGKEVKADEVLLTIPADLGQVVGKQAEEFKKLVGITGVFLTKMDGTAKGGGALTACAVVGVPIKFIGTGEKVDAIETFDPERFISRLIGFGDLQSLLEKAQEAVEPEKARKVAENIVAGRFTMEEFFEQLKAMQKMGSLKDIIGMMPGGGGINIPKNVDLGQQESKMKKWSHIIQSMTRQEKANPEIISPSRTKRIANGS